MKQIRMIWITRIHFFPMVRSIDLQLQIRGHSEEQRPRQSVWDLNKCTTVGDWISGLVAVTACAGRERAGSLQPVSAGMRCKGQASSLCKRPGYIQGRQKPACVVPPPASLPQRGAMALGRGRGHGWHNNHSVARVSALQVVKDLLTMRAMPMRKRTTANTRPPILKDS